MRWSAMIHHPLIVHSFADLQERPCTFGAPLVASLLQRFGALSPHLDPKEVTPSKLEHLDLEGAAYFKRPVPIRTM